jgi:methylated-DNA-[protein]-cysteine S-methyltransferase
VLWDDLGGQAKVRRIILSRPGWPADRAVAEAYPEIASVACAGLYELADRIQAFLGGENVVFELALTRLELCLPFQQEVLRAEHEIPRGWVSTYGRIASHLDRPTAARAVGLALARNPFPIIVPCHRAIRTDGRLGGFQGGLAMKRKLLDMEGVNFRNSRLAGSSRYFY